MYLFVFRGDPARVRMDIVTLLSVVESTDGNIRIVFS